MSFLNIRFPLGRVVATPAVIGAVSKEELFRLLERHHCGDWGDVSETDAQANEYALRNGLRIISWYQASCGERIMVITEADRSATTVLLAREY